MAKEPTPLIVSFIDGDAVDPGLQTALTAEMADVAEDFQEDFLGHIARVARIIQQTKREIVNWLLESLEQGFIGRFRAAAKLADQKAVGLALAEFGPRARCSLGCNGIRI